MYHPKLLRQISKFLQASPEEGSDFAKLLTAVSYSYYDQDRNKELYEQAYTIHDEEFRNLTGELNELRKLAGRTAAEKNGRQISLHRLPMENPNPVIITGKDGRIIFSNNSADKIEFVFHKNKQLSLNEYLQLISPDLSDKGQFEIKSNNNSTCSFSYKKSDNDDAFFFFGTDKTEEKKQEQKAYDNFYRLNNFLESTEDAYYIIYKNKKEKNFFTSMWPLFFGFNPAKEENLEEKKRSTMLAEHLSAYTKAITELSLNGRTSVKYEIVNPLTKERKWLLEDIRKKFDPFLSDEIITGRITDITSEEYYKYQVKESEERFQKITEALPVMIWVSDENNRVTYTNFASRNFYRHALETMRDHQDYTALIDPAFFETAVVQWQEHIRLRNKIDISYRVKNKHNEYRWIHELAVPRFLPDGQFLGYAGASYDITAEQEYRQKLEEDKKIFELIARNSADVIMIIKKDGTIEYVSPSIKRLTDYTEEEVIHQNILQLICDNCLNILSPVFNETKIPEGQIRLYTFQMKHRQNKLIWVETALSEITEQEKAGSSRYLLHIRDINEQQIAHDVLKESEVKYRSLFENMNLGILEVDSDDRIIYANDSFTKISGYELKELENQIASAVLQPTEISRKRIEEQNQQRLNNNTGVYEIEIKRKDQITATWIISGAPTYDINGKIKGSVGIHWDVTEIREIERKILQQQLNKEKEILEAKLQAEEEQKAVIGRDLHDGVGQMLAYMSLYLHVIKAKPAIETKDIDELDSIVAKLIEQIRRLARTLAPPAIEDLGLREAVIEMIESYSVFKKPVFQLRVYPETQEHTIKMDKKIMLYRVLQELITNSFKYADAETIKIHLFYKNNDLCLKYADDGKGFDQKTIRKGVGLDSMHSRIEFYKGALNLTSSPGNGTKATIFLPADETI